MHHALLLAPHVLNPAHLVRRYRSVNIVAANALVSFARACGNCSSVSTGVKPNDPLARAIAPEASIRLRVRNPRCNRSNSKSQLGLGSPATEHRTTSILSISLTPSFKHDIKLHASRSTLGHARVRCQRTGGGGTQPCRTSVHETAFLRRINRLRALGRGWLRGRDLNPRPLGYEPNELPDCSTPHLQVSSPLPCCQVTPDAHENSMVPGGR